MRATIKSGLDSQKSGDIDITRQYIQVSYRFHCPVRYMYVHNILSLVLVQRQRFENIVLSEIIHKHNW